MGIRSRIRAGREGLRGLRERLEARAMAVVAALTRVTNDGSWSALRVTTPGGPGAGSGELPANQEEAATARDTALEADVLEKP